MNRFVKFLPGALFATAALFSPAPASSQDEGRWQPMGYTGMISVRVVTVKKDFCTYFIRNDSTSQTLQSLTWDFTYVPADQHGPYNPYAREKGSDRIALPIAPQKQEGGWTDFSIASSDCSGVQFSNVKAEWK